MCTDPFELDEVPFGSLEAPPAGECLGPDVVHVDALDDLLDGSEALRMDGYDHCIVGVARQGGTDSLLLLYDVSKVLEALMRDGMSYSEALEFFEFNQAGAWMGPGTPLFLEWQVEHG